MKNIFTLLTAFCLFFEGYSQNTTSIEFSNFTPYFSTRLQDGNILSGGTNGDYACLVKTNILSGNIVWAKAFINIFHIDALRELSDGSIAFTGNDFSSYPTKFYYGRIDPNGNILWAKYLSMGNTAYEYNDIEISPDNNLLFMFSNTEFPIVLKSDLSGNTIWAKSYQDNNSQGKNPCFDLAVAPDGGITVGAKRGSDPVIIRINPNGSLNNNIAFTITDYSHVKSVLPIAGGKTLFGGFIVNNINGYYDGFLALLDQSGNVIFFNIYSTLNENVEFRNLEKLPNGDIRIIGGISSMLSVIETDSVGNVKNINTSDYYYVYSKASVINNEAVITGATFNYNVIIHPLTEAFSCSNSTTSLAVTEYTPVSKGSSPVTSVPVSIPVDTVISTVNAIEITFNYLCGAVNVEEINQESAISLYPNPFTESVNLSISEADALSILEVYDITGKKIKTVSITPGTTKIETTCRDIAPGTYLFRITSGEKEIYSAIAVKK